MRKCFSVLIFLIINILFSLFSVVGAYALDETATTCNRIDVEDAIYRVKSAGGGTVYIPIGDCNWNGSSVTKIGGDVSIIGAGKGKTILRVTDGSDFFYFNQSSGSSSFWRVSGITFYSDLGCKSNCQAASAIQWRKTLNYRIDNNHFEGYFGGVFGFKSSSKGIIDHNTFINKNEGKSGSYYGISAGMPYENRPSKICNTEICACEVGSEPTDRNSFQPAGYTVIVPGSAVINNAGGAGKGTVRRIYLDIASADVGGTVRVAAFKKNGSNSFSARGRASSLTVKQGKNILSVDNGDFNAFPIEHGDYIGVYLNGCSLEADDGSVSWVKAGDQTQAISADFGNPSLGIGSIWAELYDNEGDYAACESDWDDWWDDETRGGGYYQGFSENWVYDENAHYIEDNTFTWYKTATICNWGGGAAFVVRHNTYENSSGNVLTGMKPGTVFAVFHDNIFRYIGDNSTSGYAMRMRADGLIYNNTLENLKTGGIWAAARNYGGEYYYTFQTRPNELYIWNNTYKNSGCNNDNDCFSTENEHQEWLNGVGDNGPIHFRAPLEGERLYNFTEYTYPHPLTLGDPIGDNTPPEKPTDNTTPPEKPTGLRTVGSLGGPV